MDGGRKQEVVLCQQQSEQCHVVMCRYARLLVIITIQPLFFFPPFFCVALMEKLAEKEEDSLYFIMRNVCVYY